MENDSEIVSDLKGLINILNDGKEGYETASENTDSIELKGVFLKFSAQRAGYAMELKDHIAQHGGDSDNETGGLLGAIHRTWIEIKQALSIKEDVAILSAVETGENEALDKYDQLIVDPETHADHLNLLKTQRAGIADALREIQRLRQQFEQR
ncbi:MAG TPA: PA2169 family four-helix-bundle protein [Pedobacter sp.]|uniref:ferritin-like domain-containing protein n=1 Tax=Pedobacter sp. TaxID=1411316 RepID=UPI002CA8C21D|nr:PA2169 family four-helix-bundle protein [Pedobacter sp.]HMI04759.1 PA2169 family four-helix-bundle protein [Pedobacter sp.]